eukprot:TRINITY_DN107351_c0_g1_i1.p1 TRINITY_DN107351_c0_g1~~TRINITY_DN107351_c0_g1_i1.p1  ORF type:complete len:160 (+),score=24.65 TRINITY_DN107351_c0_g1_i1:437-916(+)
MESKQEGESSMSSSQEVANIMNPNTRITPTVFNGDNYKDWAYSAKIGIGGAKRLGYIIGSTKEPSKTDPKYSDWESKNMFVINWILTSMEKDIAASFEYCNAAKEVWESIEAAYAQKKNSARILELTKEIAAAKQGELSIGNYYSKFRALWHELEVCNS